jgi:hypothetical protein
MTHYETWPGKTADPPDRHRTARTGETDRNAELARKAVRARALTDPLGAKGFRDTSGRMKREGSARRVVAVGAAASFVASFGFIALSASHSSSASLSSDVAQVDAASLAQSLTPVALLQPINANSTSTPPATATDSKSTTAAVASTTKRSTKSTALKTATKTPTPSPIATATPTDTPTTVAIPSTSHVRSQSSG